jgi:hypothetical protein
VGVTICVYPKVKCEGKRSRPKFKNLDPVSTEYPPLPFVEPATFNHKIAEVPSLAGTLCSCRNSIPQKQSYCTKH